MLDPNPLNDPICPELLLHRRCCPDLKEDLEIVNQDGLRVLKTPRGPLPRHRRHNSQGRVTLDQA